MSDIIINEIITNNMDTSIDDLRMSIDSIMSDNSNDSNTTAIDYNENVFLNEIWNLWFHDPFDQNWGKESYKFLYKIDTIQNFWKITKLIQDKADIGMFFLFREYVFPLWDDPLNMDGGALSMKVLKTDAYTCWEDLTVRLVSENLLKEKNLELSETINGLSLSPKKTFCIIKIWLKDNQLANPEKFNVLDKYHGKIMYKKHTD